MLVRSIVALLLITVISPVAWSQWQLEAVLNGSNEVPPIPSMATGFGYFTLNRPANTITYYISVTGMSGTAAHLHMAPAGMANAAVFIGLSGGPTVWEGTTPALTSTDVITLLNEGLYVNVHSATFPGGEIRGQLVPASRTSFAGTLNGAQETPPNASTATGVARVRLNEPERRVIYDVKTTGLVNVTVAHIHTGAPGVAGPPLVTLNGGPSHFCGVSQVLTAAEVTALKANGMYVNVHTVAFGGGEIRGQLLQQVQPFSVVLDGAQETPPNGSPSTGCGTVKYDPVTNTLSYAITFGALPSGYLVAHFHRGVVGQAGPAIIGIGPGPTSVSGTTAPLTPAQLVDLFKGNFYVNIHSNTFTAGEIRGQVRPDPYIFGFGGEGTSGKPRIDAAGYNPPAATNVAISLTNAVPNAGVLLFVTTSATFSTVLGAPLPAPIAPVGTLWVDADPALFTIPLTADASGCAELLVPVPTDASLACFKGYLQCVSTDPINALNLLLSDALELTILP